MSRLSPVSCSLQAGWKGTDGWEKTEGGVDGGSGSQALLDTPDNGDEKMSTRWEWGVGRRIFGEIGDE